MSVQSHESESSCMCVGCLQFASVSTVRFWSCPDDVVFLGFLEFRFFVSGYPVNFLEFLRYDCC